MKILVQIRQWWKLGAIVVAQFNLSAAELVVGPETPDAFPTAAGTSSAPRISADGRWIAFSSDAGNLVPGDAKDRTDVFLHDRETGTTVLVSRRDGGGASADGDSSAPDLSADGRYVAFQSTANDLVPSGWVPPTTNSWRSLIYRFDRVTGEMRLINVNRPAYSTFTTLTNTVRELVHPVITPDGQQVLFGVGRNRFTVAANDPAAVRELDGLFVWEAATGITEHIFDPKLLFSQEIDNHPQLSADGRFVAFSRPADFIIYEAALVTIDKMNVITYDRVARTSFAPNMVHTGTAVSPNYSLLRGLSADGSYVLYERRDRLWGDSPNFEDGARDTIWLHHLPSGWFRCVSTNASLGVIGNAPSSHAAMNGDGNWVAYFTKASNLDPSDDNGVADVYLYERATETNLRISTDPAWQGPIAGKVEVAPKLTPDGRFIVYQAMGSGLFRYDRVAGTNALITADVLTDEPDISADGRYVVFTASAASFNPGDPNPHRQLFCHDFFTGQTSLISARDPAVPSATPNGASSLELAAVSATGRFVAFTGYADDLGEGADRTGRLWVRDMQLGTNILVSVAPGGQPITGTDAFRSVQLSSDGRWVSYVTADPSLVAADGNEKEDVFLRDLQAGSTRLVSRLAAGGGTPLQRSHSPALSRNGSMLVFKSDGTGITSGGSSYDLYAHSVAENTNRLATQVIGGLGGPNVSSQCELPLVSPDGRWLLFRTQAYNIYRETTSGGFYKLVLKDLTLQFGGHFVEAHRIDLDSQSQPLPGNQPGDWAFSADSQWLVFNYWDSSTSGVYRRQTENGPVELITTNGFRPLIANGGNVVAWQSRMPAPGYNDTNATWDVLIHRVAEGITQLVSVDQTGSQTGNGASQLKGLSPDGRHVLFSSHSSDLVAGDDNRGLDLFLRDTVSGVTVMLTRSASGAGGDYGFSGKATFTDDGTKVVFESFAANLVANDFNRERDVFIAQVQLPDSDNDQLPDDWELTYFDDVTRDGLADSDGDGASDLAEFRAGTSPINSASVLRAIAVTGIGSGATDVFWSAVPGRTYQVQFRDSFNDPGWTNLGSPVTATTTNASAPDPSPGDPNRFYRVLLVE